MKRVDELKTAVIGMGSELHINGRKITREINSIFNNEINHFRKLLIAFNEEYNCIRSDEIEENVDKIKEILNSCRNVLVNEYDRNFTDAVENLTNLMYQYYFKKMKNGNAKFPRKDINQILKIICKFDCFNLEDKLENDLLNFASEFAYKYVNSESAYSDSYRLIKNLKHDLMLSLKKTMSNSINDKEDIISRYNTEFKRIILQPEISKIIKTY